MTSLNSGFERHDGLYLGADVGDTLEALFSEQGSGRPMFFWFLLLLLGGALGSLPLIKIDLMVRARGVVDLAARPAEDSFSESSEVPGSPHEITVEAFLREGDVKFLRLGQSALIQYDAYPYTEWGSGSGTVVGISNEAVMLDQRALFKVMIRSDTDRLRLEDGRVGRISDGMAASLHFIVNRKSLFRMIYQKSEDLFGL